MAGSDIWAGNGTMPQAVLLGSYMQQHVHRLCVGHLTEPNWLLKELSDIASVLLFWKLHGNLESLYVVSYSDVSYNIVTGR